MSRTAPIVHPASAVAIGGRAVLIEGPCGSGKSSLALALIDRGAQLIGDDAVSLWRDSGRLMAGSPPNIAGLIELRGIGIAQLPAAPPTPVALVLTLGGPPGERLPSQVATREIAGLAIPVLPFDPGTVAPAARAEWALRLLGLPDGDAPR